MPRRRFSPLRFLLSEANEMAVVTVGTHAIDVEHVAAQLNAQFDLPFIPESVEQAWLEFLVGKIVQVISGDLVQVLVDAANGLTPEEIEADTETLTRLGNQIIDIPVLTENMEASLIRPVVKQLLSYAVAGKALTLGAA